MLCDQVCDQVCDHMCGRRSPCAVAAGADNITARCCREQFHGMRTFRCRGSGGAIRWPQIPATKLLRRTYASFRRSVSKASSSSKRLKSRLEPVPTMALRCGRVPCPALGHFHSISGASLMTTCNCRVTLQGTSSSSVFAPGSVVLLLIQADVPHHEMKRLA